MAEISIKSLAALRAGLADGVITPTDVARAVVAAANGNASRNTYIWFDADDLMAQAKALEERFPAAAGRPPLYGVPVSLKDCFDMKGTVTTFGTRFYARRNGVAATDSAMAARLREAGCLITGKAHLHPLAYGITGQNPDYGDCLQPRDAARLTGGSSSGAVASVQEGSAAIGIGTDTGGSVRVPAALGGLVGFRASLTIASSEGAWPEVWRGALHLAESFDTPGFLLRDVGDVAMVASALMGIEGVAAPEVVRVGCVDGPMLETCAPEVREAYELWQRRIATSAGVTLKKFEPEGWSDTPEIFAGIQAHEAAGYHRGHFAEFEASIAQRLAWGESLTDAEVAALRVRRKGFNAKFAELFERFDVVMLPCAPVSRLLAAEDHSSTRAALLRYTTPFSLAGVPVLSLPGEMVGGAFGTGVQIAAASGCDAMLLAWGAAFAQNFT